MTAIVARGLRKSYGSFEAVKGIDFAVDEGEVFALLGPNGAGKTSTVEVLEGFRPRNGGDVTVLGMDPATGGRALRERVGIVLQECGIEPYLKVEEVVRLHAGYYPAPRAVDEVIDLVGLSEKSTARVKTLSGGQQRRLDFALGLIGDPELIFLDEPTTGFDPSARRASWEVIRNLCRLGKTVLLTTHYMDEAQELADRVAVIADGRLIAEGAPDSIGGRDTAAARIRFALPPGTTLSDLPVSAAADGDKVVVESTEPTADLHRLTAWAVGAGLELPGLTVSRPTLEDVYLELTAAPAPSPAAGEAR